MDKVEEQKLKARERTRLWRLANPGRHRDYYHNNKAKVLATRARWRAKNKAKIAEQKKKAYWANREKIIAKHAAYYRANREKRIKAASLYATLNPQKRAEYLTRYYFENLEESKSSRKAWRTANPGKQRASRAKRRALLFKAVPQTQTDTDRAEIEFLYGLSRAVSAGGVAHHVDHFIPLTKGGKHCPTNLRVIPAVVNLKKKDKLLAA